jgi:dCTP deaminase
MSTGVGASFDIEYLSVLWYDKKVGSSDSLLITGGNYGGVLSGRQIRQLVKSGKLCLEPFDETLVQPATYDLRLGPKILASPLSADKLGVVIELTKDKPSYDIQSGQMVGILSLEKLYLPLDMCGRFGIRSAIARKGIDAFGGLQLDPGFRGRLTMNLLNVGPEPVTLTLYEAIFTVEFSRLEEEAEDQDDFSAEQYNYILSARTTSLAEIPTFRRDIRRLNALIEELGERMADPDAGLELKPEVEERLARSSKLPRKSLILAADMRKQLGL